MGHQSDGAKVRAAHRLQYGVFRLAESLLKLLPLGGAVRLGRFFGLIAYAASGKYRRLAKANLRIAFAREWSEKEISRTAREHFKRLGGNMLAGFRLPLMAEDAILRHVTCEGIEHCEEALRENRSIVYAVCHLSCWEMLTQVPKLFLLGKTAGSIYQPLANPLLDALILRRRQKLGYHLFDRSQGFNEPMKFVREGGWLGVLVDQHAGDHGVWCPFFGRLASTTSLAAMMARRGNSLLLPIMIQTKGVGRWHLKVLPPVFRGGERSLRSIEQVTAQLNLVVEQMIRENPADWFWVHKRWKTPKPNFLLNSYRRGIELPAGMSSDALQRFEVLVRSPNWLGDACMALPAVRALKQGRPDLRLTVFGPEKLRDLWLSQPEVDAYIGKESKDGLWQAARRLRAGAVRYDAGILFTNSTRSTLEFWLAGIPRLAGYHGSLRAKLLNQICPDPTPCKPPLHHAEKYLNLIRHAGATGRLDDFAPPRPPQISARQGTMKLGLCAGAEYGQAKRWPLQRYAQAANQISQRLSQPVEWLLFGAPGEAQMGGELSAQITVAHRNLVGKTGLKELIEELRGCDLLLTNDTGTMHLAAALGVPTVSIFGSTEPSLTGPMGTAHTILRHHVPCSPCFKRECPFGHYECMTGMEVNRVVQAVIGALNAASAD